MRFTVLGTPLVDLLTGPHGLDRYTELVEPTWSRAEARARVVDVRRTTPRTVTLTLVPNAAFGGFTAGQHLAVSVEIDGRRRTRCYSPAGAQRDPRIELTVGRHDHGLVSRYLHDRARPGMVLELGEAAGEFVLPAKRPGRILFVSGGTGITPVMSMLRSLRGEGHTGEIAFVHYARSAAEACYRDELAAMTGVRVLHGFTRAAGDGDLGGHCCAEHLGAAMPDPDAVYVCGPPALVEAVTRVHPDAYSETFVPPASLASPRGLPESCGGAISFADSAVTVEDDGRPLLEQAEAAGLRPKSGCRMGICHTCTRRKTTGTVENLITGAVSSADGEDVQLCVSAARGDVSIAL